MDQQQFYPTPPALAKRLWALFKNQEFSRVLEPSAGTGDLIKAMPRFAENERYRYRSDSPIDVIEIDMNRHSALRELGVQVVGLDFLEHTSGSIYSHIILNPPFNAGATHCLKAWDILWAGGGPAWRQRGRDHQGRSLGDDQNLTSAGNSCWRNLKNWRSYETPFAMVSLRNAVTARGDSLFVKSQEASCRRSYPKWQNRGLQALLGVSPSVCGWLHPQAAWPNPAHCFDMLSTTGWLPTSC